MALGRRPSTRMTSTNSGTSRRNKPCGAIFPPATRPLAPGIGRGAGTCLAEGKEEQHLACVAFRAESSSLQALQDNVSRMHAPTDDLVGQLTTTYEQVQMRGYGGSFETLQFGLAPASSRPSVVFGDSSQSSFLHCFKLGNTLTLRTWSSRICASHPSFVTYHPIGGEHSG